MLDHNRDHLTEGKGHAEKKRSGGIGTGRPRFCTASIRCNAPTVCIKIDIDVEAGRDNGLNGKWGSNELPYCHGRYNVRIVFFHFCRFRLSRSRCQRAFCSFFLRKKRVFSVSCVLTPSCHTCFFITDLHTVTNLSLREAKKKDRS